MRKLISFLILIIITVTTYSQPKVPGGISVRGGIIANLHENVRSYFRNNVGYGIITSGFAVDGMYEKLY